MNELALFAGAGGGILGGKLCGFKCVGAVEFDWKRRGILAQRQNDGCLDSFPIWDDVETYSIENPECRAHIEQMRSIRHNLVITGGFPCPDISVAGKGAGIEGSRSNKWKSQARIIREIGPAFALVENSPALVIRGLGTVLGDLAEMGYDARWGVLGVGDAGGLHERNRIWLVAYPHNREARNAWKQPKAIYREPSLSWCKDVRRIEDLLWRPDIPDPILCRGYNGIPIGMDRVAACGDAQHPAVVKLAWETLRP